MCNRGNGSDSRLIRAFFGSNAGVQPLHIYARSRRFLHSPKTHMCDTPRFCTLLSTARSTSSCKAVAAFHILLTSFIHTSRPLSTKNIPLYTVSGCQVFHLGIL